MRKARSSNSPTGLAAASGSRPAEGVASRGGARSDRPFLADSPGMTRPAPSAELRPIDRLLAIMARLRDRADGCQWDVEQTFATIAPYTVEEAYEVADAIERGDLSDL